MKRILPAVEPVPIEGSPEAILAAVARMYALHPALLIAATRAKSYFLAEVRSVAAWILHRCAGVRIGLVAKLLGFKAHSAVIRSIKNVNDLASTDADFHQRLQAIINTLSSK